MIQTVLRSVWPQPADFVRDVLGVSGAALLSYGAAEIYRPAGFIVGGVLLIVGAYLSARNRG